MAHTVEHVYVTAAAGSTKARTVQDYVAAYPHGWNAQTGDRYTVVATVFDPDALETELKDAADADGIKQRTLDRARKELGVVAGPDGFRGRWMWQLPQSAPNHPECAKDETLAHCGETGALCSDTPDTQAADDWGEL